MKRLRLDELGKKEATDSKSGNSCITGVVISGALAASTSPSVSSLLRAAPNIGYAGGAIVSGGNIKVGGIGAGVGSEGSVIGGMYGSSTIGYGVMPSASAGVKPQAMQQQQQPQQPPPPPPQQQQQQLRNSKGGSPPMPPGGPAPQQSPSANANAASTSTNFQRLKVEDALSYLDLVKYKFGSQPQVYNDFLDIMKEFKSQSIDTPGVIQRVSNLFRGFPDLIVGFNTFLPPGYKIEVQRNDQGYAFQVSVSMPSPTGALPPDPQQQQQAPQKPAMIFSGTGTIIHNNLSATPQTQPQQLPSSQPVTPLPHQIGGGGIAPASAPPPPTSVLHHASAFNNNNSNNNSGGPGIGGGGGGGAGNVSVHNNSQHSVTMSAAHAAVNQALQEHSETPQNQPVEFNHAINYVNKIKNRFQGQPEKYKRFLEILHTYQKEQRTLKESIGSGSGKHLTEQEVYSQVAKLFENQSDLLAEFGQFLPDATSHNTSPTPLVEHAASIVKKQPMKQSYRDHIMERHVGHKPGHLAAQIKRSPPYQSLYHRDAPPPKKHKISSCRDVSIAEAGKYGTLNDYAFFDKVRKALRSPEVYNNFLRCLTLFNQEIVSKSELVQLVTPFLGKCPELLKWFREFLGQTDTEPVSSYNATTRTGIISGSEQRPQNEHLTDVELATAKRLGASYCTNLTAQESVKCSGRTQLCREVLNDQWVSFPTWSEDSTFVSSRKTQYEEYMYRCEDERFELDVVIETNASTIRVLEGLQKRLSRMSPDEVSRYRLDDCLGGSSPILHQRALKRIYGDKAQDIIDGLKRSPAVAVPVVLRRLKAKEEEWREAQKGFNKIWREQNEKYYLKSLDHQGINFKQTDVKALRSKSLFNEIELLYDERHEQNEENGNEPITGPHLIVAYRDRTILDDAANLLIHHVKRQTGIQKGEKRRIKQILRQFVPDLFFHPRQQFSDDEKEDDEEKEDGGESSNSTSSGGDGCKVKEENVSPAAKSPARAGGGVGGGGITEEEQEEEEEDDEKCPNYNVLEDGKIPTHAQTSDAEEAYTIFMANNNWYIFMRLHAILCERLAKIYERAVILAAEEAKERINRKESTAVALRLKPKPQIEVEDYYPAFLDMVKNLLDGNMDSNAYEDTLREMFGIHAYTVFTLDKVVQYAVRQLQHCVTERSAIMCTDLFQKEQKRAATGGPCSTARKRLHLELAYQRAAEACLQDDSCYKMYTYKRDCKLTIELVDTEPDDPKKVEQASKWSCYKERFADAHNTDAVKAPRSPIYLVRNLRIKAKSKRKSNIADAANIGGGTAMDACHSRIGVEEEEDHLDESSSVKELTSENSGGVGGGVVGGGDDDSRCKNNDDDEEENKINVGNTLGSDRKQTVHPGYNVSDETQCKFNSSDSKMLFTVSKDSYLYKHCAFSKARKTHPSVTKRLGSRFHSWLKKWTLRNVSDSQQKQCTDWLMGKSDGVVPNRTRILTDNDLSRSPYSQYNRYRVERLTEDVSS